MQARTVVARWQQSGRDGYSKSGGNVDAVIQKWNLVSKYVLHMFMAVNNAIHQGIDAVSKQTIN